MRLHNAKLPFFPFLLLFFCLRRRLLPPSSILPATFAPSALSVVSAVPFVARSTRFAAVLRCCPPCPPLCAPSRRPSPSTPAPDSPEPARPSKQPSFTYIYTECASAWFAMSFSANTASTVPAHTGPPHRPSTPPSTKDHTVTATAIADASTPDTRYPSTDTVAGSGTDPSLAVGAACAGGACGACGAEPAVAKNNNTRLGFNSASAFPSLSSLTTTHPLLASPAEPPNTPRANVRKGAATPPSSSSLASSSSPASSQPRRRRNTKNLSLSFAPKLAPAPLQTASSYPSTASRSSSAAAATTPVTALPMAPAQTPRKLDISANSSKMITSPRARSPKGLATATATTAPTPHPGMLSRQTSVGSAFPSIYSPYPSTTSSSSSPQQPALSRTLSLKIPKSPKKSPKPCLVRASTSAGLSSQDINVVPPVPQTHDLDSPALEPSNTSHFAFTETTENNSTDPPLGQRMVVVSSSMDLSEECMETAANAYPDGPLLVCEPEIYLYSEPTREEAAKFDVVINVAREVKNPFETTGEPNESATSTTATVTTPTFPNTQRLLPSASFGSSSNGGYSSSAFSSDDFWSLPSSPPSSVESNSDMALLSPYHPSSNAPPSPLAGAETTTTTTATNNDWQPSRSPAKTPTTSTTITPASTRSGPEYIYVPWDHNSTLTNELEYLTSLMIARSAERKRILVHCQCGVSRSASLIVAYVMRTRSWDLHQAYEWVKARAGSISPNMTLIYQLMEWGKMCNAGLRDPEHQQREHEQQEQQSDPKPLQQEQAV